MAEDTLYVQWLQFSKRQQMQCVCSAVGDNLEDAKDAQIEWIALLKSARQHQEAHLQACTAFRILQGQEGKKDKHNANSAYNHYQSFKMEVASLIKQHPEAGIAVPDEALTDSSFQKGADWQYVIQLVFQPRVLFERFLEVCGILA